MFSSVLIGIIVLQGLAVRPVCPALSLPFLPTDEGIHVSDVITRKLGLSNHNAGPTRKSRGAFSVLSLLWPQVVGPIDNGRIKEEDFDTVPKTTLETTLDQIRERARLEVKTRQHVRDMLNAGVDPARVGLQQLHALHNDMGLFFGHHPPPHDVILPHGNDIMSPIHGPHPPPLFENPFHPPAFFGHGFPPMPDFSMHQAHPLFQMFNGHQPAPFPGIGHPLQELFPKGLLPGLGPHPLAPGLTKGFLPAHTPSSLMHELSGNGLGKGLPNPPIPGLHLKPSFNDGLPKGLLPGRNLPKPTEIHSPKPLEVQTGGLSKGLLNGPNQPSQADTHGGIPLNDGLAKGLLPGVNPQKPTDVHEEIFHNDGLSKGLLHPTNQAESHGEILPKDGLAKGLLPGLNPQNPTEVHDEIQPNDGLAKGLLPGLNVQKPTEVHEPTPVNDGLSKGLYPALNPSNPIGSQDQTSSNAGLAIPEFDHNKPLVHISPAETNDGLGKGLLPEIENPSEANSTQLEENLNPSRNLSPPMNISGELQGSFSNNPPSSAFGTNTSTSDISGQFIASNVSDHLPLKQRDDQRILPQIMPNGTFNTQERTLAQDPEEKTFRSLPVNAGNTGKLRSSMPIYDDMVPKNIKEMRAPAEEQSSYDVLEVTTEEVPQEEEEVRPESLLDMW